MEIRPIPGHPGYYASDTGEIWSTHSKCWRWYGPHNLKKKSCRPGHKGYLYTYLTTTKNGKRVNHTYTVHRLVALAWYGPPPNAKSEVRHLNGRPNDARPANLRYGTFNANLQDRMKHGRFKLSNKKVKEMRALMMEGVSIIQIAAVYNAGYSSVWQIMQGLAWRRRAAGLTPEFREWQREALDKHRQPCDATIARLAKQARA